MTEFFGSVWWLLVSLGVLVTFHEFGHFWVARRCGVRVLRFSVGFGRPLWLRRAKDGTEYAVAAIPLGGYVRMLDEREQDVAPEHANEAFNRKSIGQRIAIVAAGPAANLLLAIALLWLMFLVGKGDLQPIVGRADGVAAAAGLERDDRILRIDGQAIPTWTHAGIILTGAALDRREVMLDVARADGGERRLRLDLATLPASIDEARILDSIGLVARQRLLDPRLGGVNKDSPAAEAGLREGDLILRIDGQRIHSFDQVGPLVQVAGNEGRELELLVERDADRIPFSLRPQLHSSERGEAWVLGVIPQRRAVEFDAVRRYGPIDAVGQALGETWHLTTATLGMLWRMVSGKASLQNLSGPISIAQYANASASIGLDWFLFFLAVLSLSLCIMNLLPIPILDGGHLLYYLIELIKGSPVSEKTLIAGQYVGLALLAGLMGLAFYNDILRLVST
jgi:regulator of sigma E protease